MNYNDLRAALEIVNNYSKTEIEELMKRCKDVNDNILGLVCREFGITKDEIKSKSRKHEYLIPRHIAVYLLRNHGELKTLKDIGRYMGGRDHSTMLHSIEAIDGLRFMGYDKQINKLELEVQAFFKLIQD